MIPQLSTDQRQAMNAFGLPLPVQDDALDHVYMLLDIDVAPDPEGGFTARIPCIAAYGSGETKQEASLALCEALRGYLDAFGGR